MGRLRTGKSLGAGLALAPRAAASLSVFLLPWLSPSLSLWSLPEPLSRPGHLVMLGLGQLSSQHVLILQASSPAL